MTSTLNEALTSADAQERAAAAGALIEHHEDGLRAARRVRDDAIREMVGDCGPAETARRTGLSLSSVRVIKGRA